MKRAAKPPRKGKVTRKAPAEVAPRKRVTLREIADKLKVSRMTVSLALRDDPHVAKTTRKKVQAAARKLGYSRDANISRLMSQLAGLKKSTPYQGEIAFLTNWSSEFGWEKSYHFSKCFQGAAARAQELGYRLTNFWTRDPAFAKTRLTKVLWGRGVRGVMVTVQGAESIEEQASLLDLDWSRFCPMHIGAPVEGFSINSVRHDHFHGMLSSLQNLEALGYRRIGFAPIRGVDFLTSRYWTSAYLHWRMQRGLLKALPEFVYSYGALSPDSFQRWVLKNRIQAVIAMEGEPYPALQQMRDSLPAPVGFSVLDYAGGKSPFSGIDQREIDIGRGAIDLLVHAIHHDLTGLPTQVTQTMIQGTWHQGQTTPAIRTNPSKTDAGQPS